MEPNKMLRTLEPHKMPRTLEPHKLIDTTELDKNVETMESNQYIKWNCIIFEFRHQFRLEMMQLFNPWNKSYVTESYLFRFLTRIFYCRERLIKLFNFRVLVTLFLRDLRSFGFNQTIKFVVLMTLPVFLYRVNYCLNEKKHMMFIAPNFTKNLLMVPHLFVSLSKYDTNLLSQSEDSPIYCNLFENISNALSIYESYMRTVAANKSLQSFQLWKRQQEDHPFQHFMNFDRKRKVDFWKTRAYLWNHPSSSRLSLLNHEPEWNILRKKKTDLNHLNCIEFMNWSSPGNIYSSACDRNKERWKKIVLEITDQFSLSMTGSPQVEDNQNLLDIDYHTIPQLYELDELNITDKKNSFIDEIIEKTATETWAQLNHKYKMKVCSFFSKEKKAFALQKAAVEKLNIESALRFYFYLKSGCDSKEKIMSIWIINESLNHLMQNAINQHSSAWREVQKKWVYRSILRIDKYINRNVIMYDGSNQAEYLRNGFKKFVSSSYFSHNYVKLKNRALYPYPNEYKVWVPIDIHLPLKEIIQFFFFKNLLIDFFDKLFISINLSNLSSNWWSKFRSKFNINYIVGHKSFIIDFLMGDEDQYDTPERMLLKEKRLALYDSLLDGFIKLFKKLNNLKPLFNKLLKWIQSIVAQILDDSQGLEFINEGTISQSVFFNEIPKNQSIGSLFDSKKNGKGFFDFDNADLWARLHDRNWLNPLKLSNKSSLRTAFEKANTIEFFDYLHHPRFNYKKRLSPYMEKIHIQSNNLTYGQLLNIFPIHNNLFSLPIDSINPIILELEKESILLIKSQVAHNVNVLAKYLTDQRSSNLYKSFRLLTKLKYLIHDKRAIFSLEEIPTTPFTREQQRVDFEKNDGPPFLNSSDSKENKNSRCQSDSSKDIDLIQNQSYAEDLRLIFETLFIKMNRIEINKKLVIKSTSTEESKSLVEKKEMYSTSPWWKCIEDVLLDTYKEIQKSTFLNKDKEILYRAFQFQINLSNWEIFKTYRLCVFTSAWWKYLKDVFLDPILQILINSRDQNASILDLIEYRNHFIIDIIDVFSILWALPQKLLAVLELKSKNYFLKFSNYVFDYVSYYFLKFSSYVFDYVSKIYNNVSFYLSPFFSNYVSIYVSKIYNFFYHSKKWIKWYLSVSSWVESFKEEIENQKQDLEMIKIKMRDRGRTVPFTLFERLNFLHPSRDFTFKEFREMKMMERLKMMERFIRYIITGLINNEKYWVLSVFSLAVSYFLLPLFLFPLNLMDSTKYFFFWKTGLENEPHFDELCQKFQTLQEPIPEIIFGWFIDHEDFRIPIKDLYKYFRRKWSYTRELKRNKNFFSIYAAVLETTCSSVDQRQEKQLAHFMIKEKSLSELGLNLLTNPKDFSFKRTLPVTADPNMPIAGYINEQPGLLYLRYLAEIFQEGRINDTNKFDSFGSAEKSVFLAFCNKITTSSQKNRWDNLNSSRLKLVSLNLGPSSSYFSKRILLIGPRDTGRSYLAKSLAMDCYVPLIRISLKHFLTRKDDWAYELRGTTEDPMLYVPSIFDDTVENKLDRKDTESAVFRRHLEVKRMQQFMFVLEMAKAMSPCIIWIPNIHELHFESSLFCILVERLFKKDFPGIIIASTHIPKKVDPAIIGSGGLNRSIHVRMLPFSQREREFAIILRSKGVYLETELSSPDEFGFRTKGFDARDLAAFTNEVFLISIEQRRSVIDTNIIRLAFNRNTRGLFAFDVQDQERLPYKVGKAFVQHTLRKMDPLFIDTDCLLTRSFYLSHWYLEPSIAESSIKELTLFCHILGCLAGSAAQDAWFISHRNRENWRSLDGFIKNDFALASSLLESLLTELSLGISQDRSKFNKTKILTLAGQEMVSNHWNMMQKGISCFVNNKILKKEQVAVDEDQDEDKFLNHLVWAPRTWRLSFLRSNQFDIIRRPNQLIELLREYEGFSDFESMKSKRDSPYGRTDAKDKTLKKWNSEMKAMLKEQPIIVEKDLSWETESFDLDYPMQYQSSNHSIFFVDRFIWNPASFLLQEKRPYLFSRREFCINEEMLRRIYMSYIPIRKQVNKNPFRKRTVLGVYRESKIMEMKEWNLEEIMPEEHIFSLQRLQACGVEWSHISPYNPSSTYSRWLIEFSPIVDRLAFKVDSRQRGTTRWLSECFIHNFLSESYQYLVNMFLSERILMNRIMKTLSEKRILFSNDIVDLIKEERNRKKGD
uniref:Uncharacterized protein n=1 Tax=Parasitaxus usta TaxID=56899 RepID=A0A5J6CG62_9CONI|nr:hypothetical protein RF2 [Parasitaxus usta]QEQ14300.1 hypothetical protein RF2 [Parasitaxus usta]